MLPPRLPQRSRPPANPTRLPNTACRRRTERRRRSGAEDGVGTRRASSSSTSRRSRSRSFTCPHSSGCVREGSPSRGRPSTAPRPRSTRAPRPLAVRTGRRSSGARRRLAAAAAGAESAARSSSRRPWSGSSTGAAPRAWPRRYAASTFRRRKCDVQAFTTARRRYASNASGCRRCRKRPTERRKASWAMSWARSASPVIREATPDGARHVPDVEVVEVGPIRHDGADDTGVLAHHSPDA